MPAQAENQKTQAKRPARPRPETDRKELRAEINKRYSKSLDYLAR